MPPLDSNQPVSLPILRLAPEEIKAGCTFSVATAAKPDTRVTAEEALAQFLDRVEQVNRDPYFSGKIVRVVLLGGMRWERTLPCGRGQGISSFDRGSRWQQIKRSWH